MGDDTVFHTRRRFGQPVIEYNAILPESTANFAANSTSLTPPENILKNQANTSDITTDTTNIMTNTANLIAFTSSAEPKTPLISDASRWHQRLGHLGSAALERLVNQTTGAKIEGPIKKIDCEACSTSKAVHRLSPIPTD